MLRHAHESDGVLTKCRRRIYKKLEMMVHEDDTSFQSTTNPILQKLGPIYLTILKAMFAIEVCTIEVIEVVPILPKGTVRLDWICDHMSLSTSYSLQ